MIGIANLAIQQRMKASVLMKMIYAYPSQTEIYGTAALSLFKQSVKPWMKSLVKPFLRY